MQSIFDEEWEARELKARMRHTAEVMHQFMPSDFVQACTLLHKLVDELTERGIKEASVEYMFLPDYLELYGMEHWQLAVQSMEWLTPFTSCEFAIRPFILRQPKAVMAQLQQWSKHENLHVRRFSSEGCRPRLPWAMALPELKQDPSPILPILEQLKNDPSPFVRKSVANNLNDISKDHPDLVLKLGKKWRGHNDAVDWVVKHACRTLLKQGNPKAMQLFGYSNVEQLQLSDFQLLTTEVKIGAELIFQLKLYNQATTAALVRIEYGIDYLKANGSQSRKVFKITERILAAQSEIALTRRQSFRIITTKKFYAGSHGVAVIINGVEMGRLAFELLS